MDDANAFLHFKMVEYLSSKGNSNFENMEEANRILGEITNAWNDKIVSKYGRKIDNMSAKEKTKTLQRNKCLF